MKDYFRVAAFFAVWIYLLLVPGCDVTPSKACKTNEYAATLERVIDGDTYVFTVEQGFGDFKRGVHVRLADLDTPEMRIKGKDNPRGRSAQIAAQGFFKGRSIVIRPRTTRGGKEKVTFARYVADVEDIDGNSIRDYLIRGGHGK